MEKYVPLLFLLVITIEDIKNKEVSLPLIVGFFVVAIILGIFSLEDKTRMLLGLVPGALVVVLAKITKGKIGIGDGVVLMGIGMYLGALRTLGVFVLGILLSSVLGMALIIIRKKGKAYEMPFIPFLFIGATICTVF